MGIGQDLLDVPFADMVSNLATAIADGQLALDKASIETLKFLIDDRNAIPLIPEVTEIVEKSTRAVALSDGSTANVDSVNVRQDPAPAVKTTLLQAGILPAFYQFTEAQIEVKLSISMRNTSTADSNGTTGGPVRRFQTLGSPVNYRTKNTYSYEAQGSSTLRITMRPVPPPVRVMPDILTVNTLATPPTVVRTER
jgi:hypothetical protein